MIFASMISWPKGGDGAGGGVVSLILGYVEEDRGVGGYLKLYYP